MNASRRAVVILLGGALLGWTGLAFSQTAVTPEGGDPQAVPWTRKPFRNDPTNFQFVIVSDRNGGARSGVFERALTDANLLQPEFVVCVGDLAAGDTEDPAVLNAQFDEVDKLLAGLDMRFYRVAGNHDLSNGVMLEMYKKRYGCPYYHFVYKNVLFLVVDTEDPPGEGGISPEQTRYMLKALADNDGVRWTIVLMHKPFYAWKQDDKKPGWEKIEAALADRPHTVFAGHWHNYAKRTRHGRSYIHLSTTGGASKLRGIEVGEFDHIVWVTMTDSGPKLVNLMLDGIYDENVRLAK